MLDKHWSINTRASILLAHSFVKQHDNQWDRGNIICMRSGQRLVPKQEEIPYRVAKGALADITRTISDQLADQHIGVNTVNSWPVNSGYLDEEMWYTIKPMFPFGRFGEP